MEIFYLFIQLDFYLLWNEVKKILHIENLLSREYEVILEQLLGAQTIKLLRTID